jgi:hypothetical protein
VKTHEGGCFCGRIRFQVEGPEQFSCFCHCHSCQKAAGGPVVPWTTFAKDRFRLTSGEMAACHSSPGVTRGFCRDCGTSLTYEHVRRGGDVDITTTSFDDPSLFPPRVHIWVEDKAPWLSIGDELPQYQKTVT